MTCYVLRDDLSYCRVGERLVFLDIGNDRYFQFPYPMEQALAAYLEEGECSASVISQLVERHILVEAKPTIDSNPSIQPVARSAMETTLPPRNLHTSELMEVFAIVLTTRMKLKVSTLKNILDDLEADRHFQITEGTSLAELPGKQYLIDAAAVFRHARLYVPVEMCCLLDSIAMTKFLLRRQIHSHVVFGIALDPFSAHCWVQVGDLVLNDTVGNASSHTPIRVV